MFSWIKNKTSKKQRKKPLNNMATSADIHENMSDQGTV